MDAIRKKMHSLKVEADTYNATSDNLEIQTIALNKAADANDIIIRDLGKKLSSLEANLDDAANNLSKVTINLVSKEKALTEVEDDVNALSRKTVLLEVEGKEADLRMGETVQNLALICKEADTIHKKVRYFESKNMSNEVMIEDLEKDLREANKIVHDSDTKLSEITRKSGISEDELKRALERAEVADTKLVQVEDGLKSVGENMKLLEISEEKAVMREEKFKEQIKSLVIRLKEADSRAEYGEMNITKLNIRIDDIEDEIVREKLKLQKLSNELGDTFDEMLNKY